MMAKETTLNEIREMLAHVVKHIATKDDIAEVHRELKGDIVRVSEQVTSIETQLRGMKHTKLQSRVADLEEEVFGEVPRVIVQGWRSNPNDFRSIPATCWLPSVSDSGQPNCHGATEAHRAYHRPRPHIFV